MGLVKKSVMYLLIHLLYFRFVTIISWTLSIHLWGVILGQEKTSYMTKLIQ